MEERKRRPRYSPELAGRMYRFFIGYDDRGLPSVHKFARACGLTVEDIERFRRHSHFDRAYRECMEIRRDYLIDRALDRRFDSSFTKFLIQLEGEQEEKDNEIYLRLEVKE